MSHSDERRDDMRRADESGRNDEPKAVSGGDRRNAVVRWLEGVNSGEVFGGHG